jgi:hypothetical protein
MTRILRGLTSRLLPCGCLIGLYEAYDGRIVKVLDARGLACEHAEHVPGMRHEPGDEDLRALRPGAPPAA